MLLTQDQEQVRDAVRAFAQAELWPHAARWDKEHYFPVEAHKGLAALGAYGICVPEEFGGANFDYLTLALVLEEIAAGDGGTSTAISVKKKIDSIASATPSAGPPPGSTVNASAMSATIPNCAAVFTCPRLSGRSAAEMLALARQRLHNDPVTELATAAEEQRKITALRLEKLVL